MGRVRLAAYELPPSDFAHSFLVFEGSDGKVIAEVHGQPRDDAFPGGFYAQAHDRQPIKVSTEKVPSKFTPSEDYIGSSLVVDDVPDSHLMKLAEEVGGQAKAYFTELQYETPWEPDVPVDDIQNSNTVARFAADRLQGVADEQGWTRGPKPFADVFSKEVPGFDKTDGFRRAEQGGGREYEQRINEYDVTVSNDPRAKRSTYKKNDKPELRVTEYKRGSQAGLRVVEHLDDTGEVVETSSEFIRDGKARPKGNITRRRPDGGPFAHEGFDLQAVNRYPAPRRLELPGLDGDWTPAGNEDGPSNGAGAKDLVGRVSGNAKSGRPGGFISVPEAEKAGQIEPPVLSAKPSYQTQESRRPVAPQPAVRTLPRPGAGRGEGKGTRLTAPAVGKKASYTLPPENRIGAPPYILPHQPVWPPERERGTVLFGASTPRFGGPYGWLNDAEAAGRLEEVERIRKRRRR